MNAAILILAAQVLTLQQAVDTARAHQPLARQAHAGTLAAEARAGEARAPLLPQLIGSAQYQRRTGNFAAPPGSIPTSNNGNTTLTITGKDSLGNPFTGVGTLNSMPMAMRDPWATFNYWNFGLTLSQAL